MAVYKKNFPSKIYDFNYDSLVSNPEKELRNLITWLGWQWDESFLFPHLSSRSVSTASSIQVRSPITSSSIGGWTNYKKMLQPAIEVFTRNKKYRYLTNNKFN